MKRILCTAAAIAALPLAAALSGAKIAGVGRTVNGMPDEEVSWVETSREWDVMSLFDGRLDTCYTNNFAEPANAVVFDALAPRSLTGWRFCRGTDESRADGDLYVVLYGSNDGETWTELTQPTTSVVNVAGISGFTNQYSEFEFPEPTAPYRYFKITTAYYTSSWPDWNGWQLVRSFDSSKGKDGYQGLDFREIELWSNDLAPVADVPQADGDTVTLSGHLANAPEGTARIEVWCGKKSCGDDLAAWRKSAAVLAQTRADVASGGAFSFSFANLPGGTYHWRIFAVASDGTAASCGETQPFTIGTTAAYPPMYVNSSDVWDAYDGNTDTYPDNANIKWQIFDVRNFYTERDALTSLRLWPRTDGRVEWWRMRGLKVYASFASNVELSAFDATGYPAEGHELHYDYDHHTDAVEPDGFDWQLVATGETFTSQEPRKIVEVPLPEFPKPPTFIKIAGIYRGNVKEIEFRTLHTNKFLCIIIR
ncbi:MAG: discoidin domain-containing protein [Kiritimatiellae bacterium]|nr:discoidin domain-containing protein [Kiritimatiellia bacterium]